MGKGIQQEINRQEKILPANKCFPFNRNGIRLGIASLEDELKETLDAWNKEKRGTKYKETKKELIQLIALGIRILTQFK